MNKYLAGVSMAVTVLMLGWLLWFAPFGLDFTDESFYLAWMADPRAWNVHIPVSMFGFIYHPLYLLFDGNIAALRMANVLIDFALAWCLCWHLIRRFWTMEPRRHTMLAAAFGCVVFTSFGMWLVTPNYNSLALQGMLVTAIGLLVPGMRGWVLVGLGGWLVFMAKPSSAGALALVVTLYLVLAQEWRWRGVLVAVATAGVLLLGAALVIDGSPLDFIARLEHSLAMLKLLGSGQEFAKIFRIDTLGFGSSEYLAMIAALPALVAAAWTLGYRGWKYWLVLFLCIDYAIACAIIALVGLPFGNVAGSALLIVPAGAFVVLLAVMRRDVTREVSRRQVALAVFFLLLPHVYAFGTNGNYWAQGGDAALFWVLAGVVLLAALSPSRGFAPLIPLAFAGQFLTAVIVNHGIEQPYRQPDSLHHYTEQARLHGGTLRLPQEYAEYLTVATQSARGAGLRTHQPVIDLTGNSPGILLAAQARPLGQPWMVGAYPGSDALAKEVLNAEQCGTIARAWLLAEPGGPRSLTIEDVLAHVGAKPQDYEIVASFWTPPYAGGYIERREQHWLRPTRDTAVATAACEAARKGTTQ